MPNLSPEVLQLLTLLATAGAIYGGVRADLKGIVARLTTAEHAIEAGRVRMDNHIERSSM
jgi:hypothetical protein